MIDVFAVVPASTDTPVGKTPAGAASGRSDDLDDQLPDESGRPAGAETVIRR